MFAMFAVETPTQTPEGAVPVALGLTEKLVSVEVGRGASASAGVIAASREVH